MPQQSSEILLQIVATIVIALILVGFIVTLFLLYQKKKLVQEKEMQHLRAAFEKELLQTKLEIQEDVLKNISMEIHDNIGQIMLLTNVNISILQTMPLPDGAPELIKETKLMLSKATEDISQLSRSLNSDRITEIGVFSAITYELKLMSQKKLFQTEVINEHDNDGKQLRKETQLLVFRMFQEMCNNIIKHAKASLVTVSIVEEKNGICLSVKDNGVGFEFKPSNGEQSSYNGVGLRSLQSRANLFRGSITIDSILHEGTAISIFIPAAPAGLSEI
jgi:two-component system NarL family sensor kinase